MQRILISSCLLGQKVRYNGTDKRVDHPMLKRWCDEDILVPICPEVAAGFPTPRPPAEIMNALDGADVLMARASIKEKSGGDVTDQYLRAAHIALELASKYECQFALLTDGSPSCGSSFIHDGNFSGATHPGQGVTAALLRENGIKVFNENQMEELGDLINGLSDH